MIELNVDAWPEIHDALRRGVPVTIVVDGEPADALEAACARQGLPHRLGPPAEFRALPETCETCGGEGLTMGYGRSHPCERCNGTGVPFVEFVIRCPQTQWHIDHPYDECWYSCDNGVLVEALGNVRIEADGEKFRVVLTPEMSA